MLSIQTVGKSAAVCHYFRNYLYRKSSTPKILDLTFLPPQGSPDKAINKLVSADRLSYLKEHTIILSEENKCSPIKVISDLTKTAWKSFPNYNVLVMQKNHLENTTNLLLATQLLHSESIKHLLNRFLVKPRFWELSGVRQILGMYEKFCLGSEKKIKADLYAVV